MGILTLVPLVQLFTADDKHKRYRAARRYK